MTSKYNGTCTRCNGSISKGEHINWNRGQGAQHFMCDEDTIMKGGKTLKQLAIEWDQEHKNDLTFCERVDQMTNSREYRNVPEDAIFQYANEDTQRNPYR